MNIARVNTEKPLTASYASVLWVHFLLVQNTVLSLWNTWAYIHVSR